MTLNVNSLLRRQCHAYCDQTAESRIREYRNKVALYLTYLHVQFNDEIKGIPLNFKHNFGLT